MRIQMLLMGAVIATMMMFSPASRAACDEECSNRAMLVGQIAANDVVMADSSGDDGELGKLTRAGAILAICGDAGKAAAIEKLGRARLKHLMEERLRRPIGSDQDTPEQVRIQYVSFLSAANGVRVGYGVGFGEMASIAAKLSKPARAALCGGANKTADELLFGDEKED